MCPVYCGFEFLNCEKLKKSAVSGVREGTLLIHTRWVACYCVIELWFSSMRPLISGLLSYFHVFHPLFLVLF